MLMGAVALLLVAAVPLTGGRLQRLGELRLRSLWLLPVALGLQVLVIDVVPGASTDWLVPVHLGTYVLGGVVVWRNRHVPGLAVLALGGLLNGVTIAVNGGTLPASASALRTAGLAPKTGDFTNSGVLPSPHLAFLGDVFAVPSWVPLANVFSIGDVLVLVGAGWLLHRVCRVPHPAAQGDPLLLLPAEALEVELALARQGLRDALRRQRELEGALAALAPRPPSCSSRLQPLEVPA